MDKQQALSILIQGCEIGQSRGAFKLQDAKVIQIAIEVLKDSKKPQAPVPETPVQDNPPQEATPEQL